MIAAPPQLDEHWIEEQLERDIARESFVDFLRWVKIRSDDPERPGVVRFCPFDYQLALSYRFEERESMVILKARQLGMSTLLKAYCIWRAWNGWNIGYWSKGDDESVAWLAGSEKEWGLTQMVAALPDWLGISAHRSGDSVTIGTGGLRVFPGTQSAGVSFTYQLVIADEAAHHPYGAENYANYEPTLSAGGQFICLSTSNPALGPSGWFYDMWDKAEAGDLPYSPVFLPWDARTGRDAAWREARRKATVGNEHAFRANYPATPKEAFEGAEGLVYGADQFGQLAWSPTRVKEAPCDWADCKWRVVGIDPGGRDPSAVVVIGVSFDERIHVYGELYERSLLSAMDVSAYLGPLNERGMIDCIFVDPSQGSLVATLRSLGWNAHPANNDKADGIGQVRHALLAGRLTVASHCTNLIHEFTSYWWPSRKHLERGGKATDTVAGDGHHADALDALRYAVLGVIKGLPRGPRVMQHAYDDGMTTAQSQPRGLAEIIEHRRRMKRREPWN